MRLSAQDKAPHFCANDLNGTKIGPEQFIGKYLLLSFYRYASCPLCNIRVHEFKKHYPNFQNMDLDLVAIFQSPAKSMKQYVGRQDTPFPIIADPNMDLYKLYKVETSWSGFLRGLLRISTFLKAFSNNFWMGKMEGSISRLPADFLIGPDGSIIFAYYGKDMGDHIPIKQVIESVKKLKSED
jgi:thioredoxin-dependent peroxiredoxin